VHTLLRVIYYYYYYFKKFGGIIKFDKHGNNLPI